MATLAFVAAGMAMSAWAYALGCWLWMNFIVGERTTFLEVLMRF